MKIFFYSHHFLPEVGGLVTVSVLLAREFASAGHDVVVLTESVGSDHDSDLPYRIVRRPSYHEMLQLTRWADIVFHNNISLRAAWPLLFIWRPWVVAHHIWLSKVGRLGGVKTWAKRVLLRRATEISISRAIADDFGGDSIVIHNPYDDTLFRIVPGIERDRDLVFVGRLVSDKGLPDLLHALEHIGKTRNIPNLTVIGSGPEDISWRALTEELGLSRHVRFVGTMLGQALVEEMNRHKIMVVPSRWNEPFGVVALEGMACGCLVIGSNGGGLSDAIGPAGISYPNGDVMALAEAINIALNSDVQMGRLPATSQRHLSTHRPAIVARRYLDVFRLSLGRW